MNRQNKNKAIKLILQALGIQLIFPIIIAGLSNANIISENSKLYSFLGLIALGLFVGGYFLFIRGCCHYIKSKGYSSHWGWLGLLSIIGLFFLSVIPPKNLVISSGNLPNESLENIPFEEINLVEIFVFYFLSSATVIIMAASIFYTINDWDTNRLFDNMDKLTEYLLACLIVIVWGMLILRDLKIAGFQIKHFIPNLKVAWQLILKIAIIYTFFAVSFWRLFGYYFSFVYPDYINYYLKTSINNDFHLSVSEFILNLLVLSIFIEILPFTIIFQGIVLQKWCLKLGNKKGILLLSLLLSLLSSIAFVPLLISTFFDGLISSFLFFKTKNLLNTFFYQVLKKLILSFLFFIVYFQDLKLSPISISNYREKHEPFLILYVILSIISCVFIINFIYKNFPKPNDKIPYDENNNKSLI
ncbi:acetyl-coenzyme A synthetase [Crocosphaera chwakensis CCY0110]|uniref:Acetyl-coenzyme A synthetase n=2 Tax=Crocosphaera TaxID=263510 RepID=A3ITE4_9CHRO|nr:acetyl-coenzyme A synthetase [Crocosphaera chwakensis CCY0110]